MKIKDTGRDNKAGIILAVVAFVLQVALAPQFELCGGRVNFMLALATLFALCGDTHRATVAGFFCGLAYDLTASVPVGLMALLLTVASFLISSFFNGVQVGINGNAVRCSVIMVFAVDLLYGLLLFFMGVQTDLFWAIVGHGFATTALTVLASLVFFYAYSAASPQTSFTVRSKGTRYKKTLR